MLNKITLHVMRQLSVGLLFVAGALTTVIWLTQSLKFVDMIINNGATPGMFAQLTVLLIPSFLTITLPIALFVVIIFTYSKMTADRELVVMSAAGLSGLQLAKPALLVTGCVALLIYSLNLFFMPESYRLFGELKWHIRYNYSQVLLEDGKFNTIGNTATVYIRERSADNTLKGIFYHDESDPLNPVTVMAKHGSMVKTTDGAQIVMFEGNRQLLNQETGDYSVLYFDRYTLPIDSYSDEQGLRTPDPREMSLPELLNVKENPVIKKSDYPKFIVEAHKRLLSPLAGFGFCLIALVCLFTGGFTRRNQTKRVVSAAVLALTLQICVLGTENISTRNLSLIPTMYAIIILPIIIGVTLLIKPIKFKPPAK